VGLLLPAGCKAPGPAAKPPQDAGGSVYLWEAPRPDGGVFYEMDALFPNPSFVRHVCDDADPANTSGPCCYYPVPDGGQPVLGAQYSVGPLTLVNTTANAGIGTAGYYYPYGYPVAQWLLPTWSAGDVLTASAPGDQLPGFSISVNVPAHID